jgi:hypothetical protein
VAGASALTLALAALTALGSALVSSAAAAADTPIVVSGGTVLPGRVAGKTGALGVTFGFSDSTMAGGPYDQPVNKNYNQPMYQPKADDPASFWDNYVEELVTAGVDFVAVDLRGFGPDNAVPDGAGDPRALTPLIDAIKRRGVADKLKIAALDDTPATLTDKKNRAVHHTGGYEPPSTSATPTAPGRAATSTSGTTTSASSSPASRATCSTRWTGGRSSTSGR